MEKYFECAHAFKLAYIDRLPQQTTAPLQRGSIIHMLIEQYTLRCQADGVEANPERMEELIALYRASWPEEILGDTIDLARRFAATRTIPPQRKGETPLAVQIDGTPCDYHDERAWFRARLDAIDIHGHSATITDYKSSFALPPQDEISKSRQLKSYAWLFYQAMPSLKSITICLDFIRFNKGFCLDIDLRDAQQASAEIRARIDQIESETQWKPNPGQHCQNCLVRHGCRAYAQAMDAVQKPWPSSPGELADLYWAAKAAIKDCEDQLKKICKTSGPIISQNRTETKIKVTEYPRYTKTGLILDVFERCNIPFEEWAEIISFPKTDLEALASKHDCLPQIQELGTPTFRHELISGPCQSPPNQDDKPKRETAPTPGAEEEMKQGIQSVCEEIASACPSGQLVTQPPEDITDNEAQALHAASHDRELFLEHMRAIAKIRESKEE